MLNNKDFLPFQNKLINFQQGELFFYGYFWTNFQFKATEVFPAVQSLRYSAERIARLLCLCECQFGDNRVWCKMFGVVLAPSTIPPLV